MEFNKIPVVLKRYSFKEKMRICTEHSRKLVDVNGLNFIEDLNGKALPWEIETFALFAVLSTNEYDNRSFSSKKSYKQFIAIINAIKGYIPTPLDLGKEEFLDNLIIVFGLTQFHLQEPFIFKYHRYKYFFNFKNEKVDMTSEFSKKFGADYNEFAEFGWLISAFYSKDLQHNDLVSKIIDFLFKKYSHVLNKLVIERENLIFLQQDVTTNIDEYLYGFKYFCQFPFVKYEDNFFLPLPHLVFQSVTSSLLFRLTEDNKGIRDVFGKEVLESYLFAITETSFEYEEIKQEFVYKGQKGDERTLDLMIKHNKQCLLIDIKSMAPSISIRNLKTNSIETTQSRLIGQLESLYKHITSKFAQDYVPFESDNEFIKENIFGCVVLLEDSYINREKIHLETAKKLNIETDSDEYRWMCANLRIVSLYDYERIVFYNQNIFDHLTYSRDNQSTWFNYQIFQYELSTNSEMSSYVFESQNGLNEMIEKLQDELITLKIIQ
ncbi:hypothetical protein [Lysinibacillus sp. K60]|uniref:hypothetical protein n=1 Tax=Lysinibacillus sp. K60 TaxID=2720027 RepID=UPI001C8C642A|nr:hypothetical protein [Lysinibacillus sp. K60]MBX8946040.1 hypothetical protein [Lysinibacillus sp. K60]